jgi:lysophospholipase L1-like esterase
MESRMPTSATKYDDIKKEIESKRDLLDQIHKTRMQVREQTAAPSHLFAALPAVPGHRTFRLLAQGDSWFDYPPGTDIIDCLHAKHGHTIVNIAVAGSTLNDEAYGLVPRELFGLPFGPLQSDDPSRIAELVRRIGEDKPQALLISAGGNDIAGEPFFSFINNAISSLSPVNQEVLQGVVSSTFKEAYRFIIDNALAAAKDNQITSMPIFIHGYDYPWPDGRGVIAFLGWKVGPWFDPVFNSKNFPNQNADDLKKRHDILATFIDLMNAMQKELAIEYSGKVFYVDLTNTVGGEEQWANELHPRNEGFAALAAKIDLALQKNMPE